MKTKFSERISTIKPTDDSKKAAQLAYELEFIGDVFLNTDERKWIEARREYKRKKEDKR